MAKDHIVAVPKPNETEVLIARERGPQAYPNGGSPADPVMAFVRDRYPGEWFVRIPALGDAGATARVTYKGKRAWNCDCPSWTSTHSCRHWEAVFVMHGGRPFAVPMAACERVPFVWLKSRVKARNAERKEPWVRCVLRVDKATSLTVRFLPTGFNTNATRVAFAEIYAQRSTVDQVAAFLANHSAPAPSSTETSSEVRHGE